MSPQISANVWIEFKEGNPDKLIWVGGFWNSPLEVSKLALVPPPIPPRQNIFLETTLQNTLLINDTAPTSLTGVLVFN
jgi:hypothetical protein